MVSLKQPLVNGWNGSRSIAALGAQRGHNTAEKVHKEANS